MTNTPDDKMLYGKALWQQVEATTDSAEACGALKAIPTHCETREVYCRKGKCIESKRSESKSSDSTINFQVRVVENLSRKSEEVQRHVKQEPDTKDTNNKHFNPFLPYETALYVGELTDHYRCLLNKFNVMDHHILMVTSRFEPQQTPLDVEDFLASQICLQAQDGLVFYNSGPVAGASVEHKHLQMIPLPLTCPLTARDTFPFEGLLSSASIADNPTETALPFSHRVIATAFTNTTSIEALTAAAKHNCKSYHRLLTDLKLSPGNDGMMAPYNMLMTRDYLWVIPRSKDSHEDLAVNALGFAGMLLVRDTNQLRQLDRIGCLELLKTVTR